jgi:spore coat polysaccharide biosynthesis predicted glycosyltransferase SpsG
MKHIVFRADGAKKVGMGHLNRCMLLADYLRYNYNILTTILTKLNSESRTFIEEKNNVSNVVYLKEGCSVKDEIESIALIKKKPVLVVLDLLQVEEGDYYLNLLNELDIKICVISDDSNYHEFFANLIINGNPNQKSDEYKNTRESRYLIGSKFFIMDWRYGHIKNKCRSISHVIVSIGGSDHNDILFMTLEALLKVPIVKEILVISSKSTGYTDKLNKFIADHPEKNIKVHLDVDSLVNYWGKFGIALSAGGNTLFERISSGIPGATICQISRQMEIANAFERLGVNVNLGYGPKLTQCQLNTSMFNFFINVKNHAKQRNFADKVVAGNGLKYCAVEIMKLT